MEQTRLDTLFNEIELIKEEGNLFFIKFDGERKTDKITVLIGINQNNKESKEIIQFHGNELIPLLEKAIESYNSHVKKSV